MQIYCCCCCPFCLACLPPLFFLMVMVVVMMGLKYYMLRFFHCMLLHHCLLLYCTCRRCNISTECTDSESFTLENVLVVTDRLVYQLSKLLILPCHCWIFSLTRVLYLAIKQWKYYLLHLWWLDAEMKFGVKEEKFGDKWAKYLATGYIKNAE